MLKCVVCLISAAGLGLGLGLVVSAAAAASLPARRSLAPDELLATRAPWIGISTAERNVGQLFGRTLRAFTASAAETVKFELYTRKAPSNPVRIFAREKDSIEKSTFDPKKPTKFVIHGYLSHQGPGSGGEVVKNAFLSAQDCNVVTVDWHDADTLEYGSTVKLTVPKVGAEVAEVIRTLQGLGADLNDVHIVGHSLGSQIAGVAGSKILGPSGAGRITGLDPAGPLFEGAAPALRLDPSDAAFVDAIHTDGGRLGMAAPTAHVDFYPEGGMHPFPGCSPDPFGLCSHCLAYTMMADAVEKPGRLVFRSCDSWQTYQKRGCEAGATNVMGIATDPKSRGSFFLAANSSVPDDFRKLGEKDVGAYVPFGGPLGDDFRC